MEKGGKIMAEKKLQPCEKCQYRKAMAKAFDVHIWGEDCPEWEKCKGGDDNATD